MIVVCLFSCVFLFGGLLLDCFVCAVCCLRFVMCFRLGLLVVLCVVELVVFMLCGVCLFCVCLMRSVVVVVCVLCVALFLI